MSDPIPSAAAPQKTMGRARLSVSELEWPPMIIEFGSYEDKAKVCARKVKLSSQQVGEVIQSLGYQEVSLGGEGRSFGVSGGARRAFMSGAEMIGELAERSVYLQGAEVYLNREGGERDWASARPLARGEPMRWEAYLRPAYGVEQSAHSMREKAQAASNAFESALIAVGGRLKSSVKIKNRPSASAIALDASAIYGGGCVFKAPDDSGWWALAIQSEAWNRALESKPWSKALGSSQSGLVKALRMSLEMDAWSDSSQSGFSLYISRSKETVYPHASWKLYSSAPQEPDKMSAALEAFFGAGSVEGVEWIARDPSATAGFDIEISRWKQRRYDAGAAMIEARELESAAGAAPRAKARLSI